MNVAMWKHPITEIQIETLKKWGYIILGPVSKKMMCGDIGQGAMTEVSEIISFFKTKALEFQ